MLQTNDVSGAVSLAVDAILGVTGVVESMHDTIASLKRVPSTPEHDRRKGVASFVYWSIRASTEFAGQQVTRRLERVGELSAEIHSTHKREALLSTINGVLGDHLAATGNPLAIPLRFRRNGKLLDIATLSDALERSQGKLLVMVHGSCMSDLQWSRNQHDYGNALAEDLGFTPIYLNYNSGLHTSENGRAFAHALQALYEQLPQLTELTFVCHSMGGLVARSACHYAEQSAATWRQRLSKIVFLGTPHHGAPLEKGGNWVDTLLEFSPYSAPLSRLGKIRSSGVTDLRYGNLLDVDWQGRDRFKMTSDLRQPVPLPTGVACFALAASLSKSSGRLTDHLIGDGLVAVTSALGRHRDPARHLHFADGAQVVIRNLGHRNLLDNHDVYTTMREWLSR